jgi:regulator of RNase E activity RraA
VNNNDMATVALRAGDQTSEFANTQATGTWGIVMMICGIITTVLPEIINGIRQVPEVEGTQTGKVVLIVAGILITVAGATMRAISTSSYNTSRGLVKAAAVRDLDLNTAPVNVSVTTQPPPVL